LNLVAWGKSNLIAVGLEDSLYFYNFLNRKVRRHLYLPQIYSDDYLLEDEYSPYICAVDFDDSGKYVSVADSNG